MIVNARSDEQLLADHLAGKPGVFDTLVSRYVEDLYAFIARFVRDPSVADDLVQETFVQVHLSAASFDRARSLRPWIFTIAANKARDFLRTKSRRPHRSLDTGASDPDAPSAVDLVASGDPPHSDRLESDETQRRVRELVDRMPEHLRMILMLGYFQQLPYAEIAEVLEIPVGTVKSRLHGAVTHFARLWQAADSSDTVKP